MLKFLHVGFFWSERVKTAELNPVFNSAVDWIRYAPNNWILWTTKTINEWSDLIKPHLGPNDEVIILELGPRVSTISQGWAKKFVWDWMTKPRMPFEKDS